MLYSHNPEQGTQRDRETVSEAGSEEAKQSVSETNFLLFARLQFFT